VRGEKNSACTIKWVKNPRCITRACINGEVVAGWGEVREIKAEMVNENLHGDKSGRESQSTSQLPSAGTMRLDHFGLGEVKD